MDVKTAPTENPLGTKPLGRLLFSLAIPTVIANVVNALYNIVDQIFIGQGVGTLGNAATSVSFPLTTICLAIGLMLGLGAAVLYAAVVILNKKTVGIDAYQKTAVQLLSAGAVMVPYLLLTGEFPTQFLSKYLPMRV